MCSKQNTSMIRCLSNWLPYSAVFRMHFFSDFDVKTGFNYHIEKSTYGLETHQSAQILRRVLWRGFQQ